MAFTRKALLTGVVHSLAVDGHRTTCQVGFKLVAPATEDTIRAKLAALGAAIQGASNALVTHTTLTQSADDVLVGIDPPGTEPYRTIEDRGNLDLVSGQLDKPVPLRIPAPITAIIDATKKEVIDFGNAALGEFVTWAAGVATDYAKRALIEAVAGIRDKAKIRREKAGVVPLLPA